MKDITLTYEEVHTLGSNTNHYFIINETREDDIRERLYHVRVDYSVDLANIFK